MRLWFLFLALLSPIMWMHDANGQEAVYVANLWGNSVSVIDPDTNAVEGSIDFTHCNGPAPRKPFDRCATGSVAVLPDGQRLYVTMGYPEEYGSGALAVVDAASRRELTRIAVGHNPNGVVVAPNGAAACVSNINDGTMSIVDLRSNRVTFTVPVGDEPFALQISPDSTVAYIGIGTGASSHIAKVDLTTGALAGKIHVGANVSATSPTALSITPDGRRMYVASARSGSIEVVDLRTDAVVATLAIDGRDSFPTVLGILPDGSRAYTINGNPTTLYEIDTASNALRNTGLRLHGAKMVISGRLQRAYVSNNWQQDVVYAIDLRTDSIVATIPVGQTPIGIAVGVKPHSQ
jgi:YVTN family beta-propeller protein